MYAACVRRLSPLRGRPGDARGFKLVGKVPQIIFYGRRGAAGGGALGDTLLAWTLGGSLAWDSWMDGLLMGGGQLQAPQAPQADTVSARMRGSYC